MSRLGYNLVNIEWILALLITVPELHAAMYVPSTTPSYLSRLKERSIIYLLIR